MFVFTVENGTREEPLQFFDGGTGDVIGEMGCVRGPKHGTQVKDHGLGDGWEAVEFARLGNSSLKEVKEFPLLGKDLVL